MKAKTIVISSPGTVLSVDQTHWSLRTAGKKIGRIPPMMVGSFLIGSEVEVTPKALRRIRQLGVPTSFLDGHGGGQTRLCPAIRNTPQARIGQFQAWSESETRLLIGTRIAAAKLRCQRALLGDYRKNYSSDVLAQAYHQIGEVLEKIQESRCAAELMGFEGFGSRCYWSGFGSVVRIGFSPWAGRNRRPPRDPVNATLSYGYAILLNRVITLIEASGLDPWIGFLHETTSRHPSLALDLVEAFRAPTVDRLVLKIFNLGKLRETHFERPNPFGQAVYLNKEGRLILLEAMEEHLVSVAANPFGESGSLSEALVDTVSTWKKLAEESRLGDFDPLKPDNAPAF